MLSEGELHVQAMRLVCEALADREKTGLEVDWDVINQQLDHMDVILQGITDQRNDDVEEIQTLRKERDAAEAEVDKLMKQLSADAVRKELEELKTKNDELIEKLRAAAGHVDLIQNNNRCLRSEVETLKGAMAADDKRLRDAEERVWPGETRGCDAPDAMADEILYLRQQLIDARVATINAQALLDAARADNVEIRRRLNEETDRHRATNSEKIELFDQKEWANQHAAELVKERDAALSAVSLQRAGIERLNTCLSKIRQHVAGMHEQEDLMEVLVDIRSALDELGEGTSEPAPATEPAHCPECERWQRAQRINSELFASKEKEIKRLNAFVGKVRSVVDHDRDGQEIDEMIEALAELDAGTTEPEDGQ